MEAFSIVLSLIKLIDKFLHFWIALNTIESMFDVLSGLFWIELMMILILLKSTINANDTHPSVFMFFLK